MARGDAVVGGKHQAYRWDWRSLPRGSRWSHDPAVGVVRPADLPWWRVPLIDRAHGDIKDLWEPARFGWVYDLIRAYAVSGDDRYAAAFFDTFDDWSRACPPFTGPQWACGQETAIRAIALLYAEQAFSASPVASEERLSVLRRILLASGERISDAIGYALSQRNNHGISEAVGLLVLGDRFRGSVPTAARWFRRGHRLTEQLVVEQFADDGWYIQHSFTYARLALDQCVVAGKVFRANGLDWSARARGRLAAAARLLDLAIDPATGEVPNHGPNDGAFVHPVSLARYRDFRPILTAMSVTIGIPYPADLPLDREVLAWLGRPVPDLLPGSRFGAYRGSSGWACLRNSDVFAFIRAGRYRTRPGHVDPLHVDIRVRGQEVIVDPGTFAYSGPPGWNNALSDAAAHNAPLVDGRSPGVKGPRFLWYRWPEAELLEVTASGSSLTVVATIPGKVLRRVSVEGESVVVADQILDRRARAARTVWLLHPDAPAEWVDAPGAAVGKGQEADAIGWFSPCYGMRISATYLSVEGAAGAAPFAVMSVRAPSLEDSR
ncbi:MAG: heparinase II/III domain-containing protein [Gemmatimonadales bacterium]